MAKKFALIMAIVLVISCLLVLTGCDLENYDNFTPLQNNPQADDPVSSNGGIAVEKGNYIYFINGWATYTLDNIFGEVLEGSIMRILKSDLDAVMASSSQKDVFDAMQEKAEVVVPKIFSQGNTSDKSVTGFYIFGERIYYFTPNAKLDKNGAARSGETCLNSCKLDGTDTIIHFVFKSRSTVTSLSYVEGNAFCTYIEDGVLKNISLQGSNDKAREIIKDVESALYDENGTCFVLSQDSTVIYKFYPGINEGEQLRLLKDGAKNSDGTKKDPMDRESYTLINAYGGECFIKITGYTNTELNAVYKIKNDNSFVKITGYLPATVKGAGEYLFVPKSDNSIAVVDFSNKTVAATKAYSSAPSFLYVKDNSLYFTVSSNLYSIDIPSGFEGQELEATLLASTSSYASSALQYDQCAGYIFLFNSTQDLDNKVYPLYVSALDLEEKETTEYNVTRLTKRPYYITADENIENGKIDIKVGTSAVTNTIAGKTVTIVVSPSSGYKLKEGSLKFNGEPLTETSTGNSYTFVMPEEHVTVTAEFELISYSITIPQVQGGSVAVRNEEGLEIISALKGQTIVITVTPNAGYKIKEGSLKYDDTVLTPDENGVVTITMSASNITIYVEFEPISNGD